MKKKLVSLMLALALVLMFVPSAFAAVELEMAYWMSEQNDEIVAMVDNFNASQSDIHVTPTLISSSYWDKLSVSVPAGTAPDVFSVNALHMVDYIQNGYLLDISDLFESGTVDLANYAPQTYSTSTVNGETWGIPRDFDTIAVFYNKAIFDQASVAYPADDWTWDDFVNACVAIKDATGIYGVAVEGSMQTLGYLTFAAGGAALKDGQCVLNTPEVVSAYQALADLVHKYQVAPTIEELNEMNAQTHFVSSMAAMYFDGSWNVNYYTELFGDDLGVAYLPVYNGAKSNIVHSLSWCGYAQTKEPEAVKTFLTYLATDKAQEYTYNSVIPAFNGLSEKWAAAYPQLNLAAFTTPITEGYAVPLPCADKNAAEIYTKMCNMISEVLQYNTVQATLDTYTNDINELLK